MTSEPVQNKSSNLWQAFWHSRLARFAKFGLVGGSGVVVNLVVFQLIFFMLQGIIASDDTRHTLANLGGILVSIFTNFLLNDGWTWGDRVKGERREWVMRVVRYYAACSIAALCQLGVASALFSYAFKAMAPWEILGVNVIPHIPLLIGIVCGMAINFPLSHFWAFRNARDVAHEDEEG